VKNAPKIIRKDNAEYHYVYGVVYAPLAIDTDWETMTASDIRKMAHDFVSSGKISQIDIGHDNKPSGARVVESFIARKGDPDYPEGAWVLGVRMEEGELWDAIRAGKLNGFSVEATTKKVPKKVMVDIAKIALGKTEENTDVEIAPAHSHRFYIEFDSEGRISLGLTEEELGHVHEIGGTVVTEESMGHTHRFFVE